MHRTLRQKVSHFEDGNETIVRSNNTLDGECSGLRASFLVDWTMLPDDAAIQLFQQLNYRDRANLSSTCQTYRQIGSSPYLWSALDLRFCKLDISVAKLLSSRCANLETLHFRGAESASAIIFLQAKCLRHIRGEFCGDITDSVLSVTVARHGMLESLILGPDACQKITSDAVKQIAHCCSKLKRLWLTGVREINGAAINALGMYCEHLIEVAFIGSDNVDETALVNLKTVKFLSLAGTKNLRWGYATQILNQLPSLEGLDVSRTQINLNWVKRLLSTCKSLRVLVALRCVVFEAEGPISLLHSHKDKAVLSFSTDVFKEVASLFVNTAGTECNALNFWRNLKNKNVLSKEIINWIEWILSHTLARIAENNPKEFNSFWLKQGATLLLSLLRSTQKEVQEIAATAIANFVITEDDHTTVDCHRAAAIWKQGGIELLLDLARSCHEGLQAEVAKVKKIFLKSFSFIHYYVF